MPETAQLAPETDEKKSRGLGSYVVWAFVAVMVYVLSSGPVMKLLGLPPFFGRIYEPLGWVYTETPLCKPLGMYWHLWLPGSFDKNGEPIRPY